MFWHCEQYKDNDYHINKTLLCEKHNIQLLHIFEDEWVYRKDIVKSIIKSRLNIYDNEINVDSCVVKEIDNITSMIFFKNNHILGGIITKIRVGLYLNDELVSLMGIIKIDNQFKILRLSNKLNTNIIGGEEKMMKYFILKYNPEIITMFVDRRYNNINTFKNLNFKYIETTKPDYWYFDNKKKDLIRHNEHSFKKNILIKQGYDSDKTERQIMEERGFLRIYDCGQIKFKLFLK